MLSWRLRTCASAMFRVSQPSVDAENGFSRRSRKRRQCASAPLLMSGRHFYSISHLASHIVLFDANESISARGIFVVAYEVVSVS